MCLCMLVYVCIEFDIKLISNSFCEMMWSIARIICYPGFISYKQIVAQLVNNLPAMQEAWVWSLGWEDLLEKGKATHSSILAWRIPRTVESMGLQKVRHD